MISLGSERERSRDADALALPAGELVRVALGGVGIQPDGPQQLDDRFAPAGAVADAVNDQRLGDDGADLQARVERGERILEDHLHLAAHGAQRPLVEGAEVRAVELDLAGGRLDQPQQRARQRRLATARFADDAERLAALHLEAHAIDGAHGALAAARREMLGEPRPRATTRSWHGVPAGGLVIRFEFLERRRLEFGSGRGRAGTLRPK